MKIEVKNLDDALDLRAGTQNTRTGQDGPTVVVAPHKTAIVELTDEDHLFAVPIGPSRPESGQSQPVAPVLKEKEVDPTLTEAKDEDIRGAIETLTTSGAETTSKGAIEIAALNAELKTRGFRDITAKRRDDASKG